MEKGLKHIVAKHLKGNDSYIRFAAEDCRKRLAIIASSVATATFAEATKGMERRQRNDFMKTHDADVAGMILRAIMKTLSKGK